MAVAFGFYPILDKSHMLSRATREVYTGDGLLLTRMDQITVSTFVFGAALCCHNLLKMQYG